MQVGVYVRVSHDRDEDETSTERQEQACRSLSNAKGWSVVEVYRDAGISAYDRRAHRPAFEKLRADVEASRLDGVLVWRSDRLFRNLRGFVDFLELLERRGVAYASVTESFDTSSEVGRLILQVLGAFAEYESATISRRLKNRERTDAERGRPHGGGKRAFGYARDGVTVVPEEANLLREAATRFLAGASLRSIAADWNKRGLFTTAGNAWQPNAISQALRSPRLAGLRQHDGELHHATWEPVFAEAEWHRLQHAMDPNRTRRRAQRRSVARHLLTGLVVCSECESPMRAQQDPASGKLRYACRLDTGCGKVSILAVETEKAVIEMVASVVDDERLAQVMRTGEQEVERQEIEAKLVASREALVELGTLYFQERAITKLEYLSQRSPLAERIYKLEDRLRGLRAEPKPGDLPTTAEEFRVALADTGVAVAERRRLLDLFLLRVEVKPVQRRGYPRFDIDRLWPVWGA